MQAIIAPRRGAYIVDDAIETNKERDIRNKKHEQRVRVGVGVVVVVVVVGENDFFGELHLFLRAPALLCSFTVPRATCIFFFFPFFFNSYNILLFYCFIRISIYSFI